MDGKMVTLANGYQIPRLCCGTGITFFDPRKLSAPSRYFKKVKPGNFGQHRLEISLSGVIKAAMQNGCTMFDTSRSYVMSEYTLGRTLRNNYSREAYYIVTKLSNRAQFERDIRKGFELSLSELGLDYVDVYLMHWPVKDRYLDSWKEMEELYREGRCKAIGVSNCNVHHLQALSRIATVMPMVDEIECHPLFTQEELRSYCSQNGIQVMAYTATGRMDERLMKTAIPAIAQKYRKTSAQVILRWHQQIGNIPIVHSSRPKHFRENTNICDFSLTEEEIHRISAVNINSRLRYDPDNCDFSKL